MWNDGQNVNPDGKKGRKSNVNLISFKHDFKGQTFIHVGYWFMALRAERFIARCDHIEMDGLTYNFKVFLTFSMSVKTWCHKALYLYWCSYLLHRDRVLQANLSAEDLLSFYQQLPSSV